jgi:hypothetical protein
MTDLELAKYIAQLATTHVRCTIEVNYRGKSRELWESYQPYVYDDQLHDRWVLVDKLAAMMPYVKMAIHCLTENEPGRPDKEVKQAVARLSSAAGIRAVIDLAKLEKELRA